MKPEEVVAVIFEHWPKTCPAKCTSFSFEMKDGTCLQGRKWLECKALGWKGYGHTDVEDSTKWYKRFVRDGDSWKFASKTKHHPLAHDGTF